MSSYNLWVLSKILMQKSKTAIIIPARMGSNRLNGKPLAQIGDRSMIQHVVLRALESKVGDVFVATDSAEIAKEAEMAGSIPILTSHAETGTDRVWEAVGIIETGHKIEYIINLQGDLPFVDADIIQKIAKLLENSDADIVTPINKEETTTPNNPSRVKAKMGKNGQALDFSREMFDKENFFWHHIGIYGFKRNAMEKFVNLPQSTREKSAQLEQLRALDNGMKIELLEVENDVISVDTVEDLQFARNLYNKLYQIV